MSTARIAIIGAAGRMGQAIAQAVETHDGMEIVARCDVGDAVEAAVSDCDVVIDFSQADATVQNCAACLAKGKPLVIGTTGQSAAQLETIRQAAKSIPVLLASNFSVGVNTLFWLTRKAAALLGDEFDLEIIETHHRLKKDAPSGTAKRLAEVLCEVARARLHQGRGARPRGNDRRTSGARDWNALGARGRCGGRSHGDFRRSGRAAGVDAQGLESGDVCRRRLARGAMDYREAGRPLQHGRRARLIVRAGIALGSNLGDRLAHLSAARAQLCSLPGVVPPVLASAIYETEPVDCAADAPPFFNAVIEIGYGNKARALWSDLRRIEASLGRPADHAKNASRTIDLDLLYFGDLVLREVDLQLPHPRMTQRRFVLEPLREIRPDLILPGETDSVAELLNKLPATTPLRRVTDEW